MVTPLEKVMVFLFHFWHGMLEIKFPLIQSRAHFIHKGNARDFYAECEERARTFFIVRQKRKLTERAIRTA